MPKAAYVLRDGVRYCGKHPDVAMISVSYKSKPKGWDCLKCNAQEKAKVATKHRTEAFLALGGKCAHCGESDWCVLQIDHVNGDGAEERRAHSNKGVVRALESKAYGKWFYSHLDRYQLLCANCHVRKTREKEEMAPAVWGFRLTCAFLEVEDAT